MSEPRCSAYRILSQDFGEVLGAVIVDSTVAKAQFFEFLAQARCHKRKELARSYRVRAQSIGELFERDGGERVSLEDQHGCDLFRGRAIGCREEMIVTHLIVSQIV